MNIEKQITLSALEAVKELYGAEVPEEDDPVAENASRL